ncbi:MAG TPA: hypothetical protein VEA92_01630 [Candidatus Paceibacterota bacterium]|nr:hypothetical protein [Candidatus Paceibacterota bacterium]
MTARQHLLAIVLLPLCLIAGIASYYRFIAQADYTVQFEGTCDPEVENCFVACEDDECTEVYYYTLVQKHAADVYAQCGPDITDCEAASVCLETDSTCSIEYCDLTEEDCIGPGEESGQETEEVAEDDMEEEVTDEAAEAE